MSDERAAAHGVSPFRPGAPSDDRTSDEAWNRKARGETTEQRQDRRLAELLQELRVAQAGVQILFAFLLVIPFQASFADASTTQRVAHVVALLAAFVASVALTAPVAAHRLLFRRHLKRHLVVVSHRAAEIGLLSLGVALVAALLLVLTQTLDVVTAWVVAAAAAVLVGTTWFGWPMITRARSEPGA